MTEPLPSREDPLHFGAHRLYFLAEGEILVAVYEGDLAPEEMQLIIDVVSRAGRPLVASISHVGALKSISPKARKKVLSDKATAILQSEEAPLGVIIAQADVIRRAIIKLAAMAAKLMSKRAQRIHFVDSLEAAEATALAYHAELRGLDTPT